MRLALTNGRVYTLDPARPWVDTVIMEDGRFTFVGDGGDWPDDGTTVVRDLRRRLVIPGIVDAHTHPTAVARSRWHVRLPWTHDIDELLAFIADYGRAHPPEEAPFLYFEYYPSTLFGDDAPTKELLDGAISDRPVLCQDFSEHAHWVNSRMLELMGVTASTPDPVPGLEMFARDDRGEPTGHLFETVHAHFLDTMYDALGWRPPEDITADSMAHVLDFLGRCGVTAVFEAMVEDESPLQAVAELDAAGRLRCRYEGAPRFRTLVELPAALETVRRYQQSYGSDRIRIRTLKLFLDGTNESGNSAVLAPDGACSHGEGAIQMDTRDLTQCLLLCNEADVDLHVHMVGDRAFRTGCDAVEAARAATGDGEWRIQVTFAHCELVDPADMHRPADLGIFVNWTTHWSGGYFGEEAETHLGRERWSRMYCFNEIADIGATVTFSSDVVTDYELDRADPFFGMQVAHTRVDPQYPLDASRFPGSVRPSADSALSLERLLEGYTIGGARQLRIDDRAGSIEVGKSADLVVLDRDLFDVPASKIKDVRAAAVLFEGEVVFGSL